jgi:undecaprenyl diphosphate synthase
MNDRPKYVAIIMDGNGRWAASRGVSVTEDIAPGPTR